MLTIVEETTRWLETYPMPHATTWNIILGLEKQNLWQQGTPESTESDNETHFHNNLMDTWAKDIGYIYHIPYHIPAPWKIEWYNGPLETSLRAMSAVTFKHWDTHLAKATWLDNTRGSPSHAGLVQSKELHIVEENKVPVLYVKYVLGKTVWFVCALGKGKFICQITFAQGFDCIW